MTQWSMVLLAAVVQGLTEFLPISSSGHIRLLESAFGIDEPQTLFDVCLHCGTLLAILAVYRSEVFRVLSGFVRWVTGRALLAEDADARLGVLLVVGSVPTAAIGLGAGQFSETHLSSPTFVGAFLILNGAVLWFTRGRGDDGGREHGSLSWRDALIVGTVQGLAILRGVSRSGSTIAAGLFLGIRRETAAVFSFLLSIPAIVGALVLSAGGDAFAELAMSWQQLAAATFLSAAVGYVALRMLLKMVEGGRLHWFAPYCWFAGAAAMGWWWV